MTALPLRENNRRDPKRQRATFGVEYPSRDLSFEKKSDIPHSQDKILGHRLTFSLERQTFTEVEFEECNFHNKHGVALAQLGHLTFDRCRFRRSFMGTAKYDGCRFRQCTFTRCDFSFGEFVASARQLLSVLEFARSFSS